MTHRYFQLVLSLLLLLALSVAAAHAKAPESEREELFYSLGVMISQTLGEFALSDAELELESE